jgi:hypothetical protein
VYRALGAWLARAVEMPPVTPIDGNDADHSHDSLAQLIAAGAVEGTSIAPTVAFAARISFSAKHSSASPVTSVFDVQSAGRAPPCLT